MSIKKLISISIIFCICSIVFGEDKTSKFSIIPSAGASIGITDREDVFTGLLSTHVEYGILDNINLGLGGTISLYNKDDSAEYDLYPSLSIAYDVTKSFTLGMDFGPLTSFNFYFYDHLIKTGLLVTNDFKFKGYFMGYGYRFSI